MHARRKTYCRNASFMQPALKMAEMQGSLLAVTTTWDFHEYTLWPLWLLISVFSKCKIWYSDRVFFLSVDLKFAPLWQSYRYDVIKGPWPDHFFDPPTYLKLLKILVPIDGSYFSHSHPEIGYSWRNNQKHVKLNSKAW